MERPRIGADRNGMAMAMKGIAMEEPRLDLHRNGYE